VTNTVYVVMGVSGSGKSLIGSRLARTMSVDFLEGDDLHSAENIERMSSGVPLTDDDRAGWLHALSIEIRQSSERRRSLVISCSALKRSYRDMLRGEADNVQFILLDGTSAMIADRIAARGGAHFMSPSLLENQLSILEKPSPDEGAWVFDISLSPDEIITAVLARTRGDNP
jgi:carbohydrate kinase (thermoresistant glucokinase family)